MGLFNFLKSTKKADKFGDTAKPNILIILPVFHLMTGEKPFEDMTTDYADPKLDLLSVYTVLYKIYCYNKLLLDKFEKDIYYLTILEKQRERIAADSLEISEQFTLLMRMFHELDKLNSREADSDLENLIAFALINKEDEFLEVKQDEDEGVLWMMKIADIFKQEKASIKKFFDICWKNSGFNKKELELWLKNES